MQDSSTQQIRRKPIWQRRRYLLLWLSIGFMIPFVFLVRPFIGSPVAIEVSHETTRLMDEWVRGDFVDYYSFLAEDLVEAGVPSIAGDPWMDGATPAKVIRGWQDYDWPMPTTENYTSIRQAIQTGTPSEKELLSLNFGSEIRLCNYPWSREEFPTIAAIIDGNAKWYTAAKETYTPYLPVDIEASASNTKPHLSGRLNSVAGAINEAYLARFLTRAAVRWGSGHIAAAFEDICFAQQIAERHRFDTGGIVTSVRHEARVTTFAIRCLLDSLHQASMDFQPLKEFPTESTRPQLELSVKHGRLLSLDAIQWKREGLISLFHVVNQQSKFSPLLERRVRLGTDWNKVLRSMNQFFDSYEELLQKPSLAESFEVLQQLELNPMAEAMSRQLRERTLLQPMATTDEIIIAYGTFRSNYVDRLKYTLERDLRRHAIQVIAGLVAWKQQHGSFPVNLELLAAKSAPYHVSSDLLIDPFCDQRLLYETDGQSFELRSVGSNGEPDAAFAEDIASDRFVSLSSEEDIVWRWPIPAEVLP